MVRSTLATTIVCAVLAAGAAAAPLSPSGIRWTGSCDRGARNDACLLAPRELREVIENDAADVITVLTDPTIATLRRATPALESLDQSFAGGAFVNDGLAALPTREALVEETESSIVPAPAAGALMIAGLAAVYAARRRRRRV